MVCRCTRLDIVVHVPCGYGDLHQRSCALVRSRTLLINTSIDFSILATATGPRFLLWEFVCSSQCCYICLLYTSPSPRDRTRSRMPSSA